MDLSKLKNRPSYPFETIAIAVAFTPRLESILKFGFELSTTLKSNLILFHIGKRNEAKEERLEKIMDHLGIDKNKVRVIWMEGDAVDTILKLSKLNIVDLLILGALERENILKYYIGSVARDISRKAKCSVMLLTHPDVNLRQMKTFVVNGSDSPKTIHTINTAVYLAKHLKVSEVITLQEMHMPALAMTIAESSTAPEVEQIKKDLEDKEQSKLKSILEQCDKGDLKITQRSVIGKPGYSIRNFAENRKADLLVINSPDTSLTIFDRIFTHDIEYILEDLPCNLLIVHSRVHNG